MSFNEKRDHWAALALSAAQPFVVTWLVTVLVAVIGYAATATAPVLGDAAWADAFHLGSSAWLLALGSTVSVGAVRIAFKPLLLTIALVWFVFRAARRAGVVSWADVCVVALTGAAAAAAAGLLALDRTFVLAGILGSALLGAAAALLAWRSWLIPSIPWWEAVERGWRYAWPLLMVLGSAGVLIMVAGFVAGHGRVDALYDAYVTGRGGFLAMTALQGLYLPNFIVWALCIASGATLHVGAGSAFSAFGSTAAPLPGIPFFGALPEPGWSLHWLVAVPVLAGVAAGVLFGHTHPAAPAATDATGAGSEAAHIEDGASGMAEALPGASVPSLLPADPRQLARDVATGIGLVFLVLTVSGALASGSLGSGRMVDVGPNAPLFALLVSIEAGLGMACALAVRWKRSAGAASREAGTRGASLRPEAPADQSEPAAQERPARRIAVSTFGSAGLERLRAMSGKRSGAAVAPTPELPQTEADREPTEDLSEGPVRSHAHAPTQDARLQDAQQTEELKPQEQALAEQGARPQGGCARTEELKPQVQAQLQGVQPEAAEPQEQGSQGQPELPRTWLTQRSE